MPQIIWMTLFIGDDMTRLTLHTIDTAPQASRPLMEKVLAANGFIPNLIGILANAPVALETYLTVSGINARSSLTLAEREIVQITAARVHGCDFCIAGHTAVALKKASLPVELVRAAQQGQVLDDQRLEAVRLLAEALIATRGHIKGSEYDDFIAAGFNEAQALEVLLGISLATLCNFANSLGGTDINPQLLPFRQGAI